MQKPTWWQLFKIKLGLGYPFISTHNLGLCDEVVIKFRDVYIDLLISDEGDNKGEIVSMGWSEHLPESPYSELMVAKKMRGDKNNG